MKKVAFIFPGQGAFYPGALKSSRLAYAQIDHLLARIDGVAERRFGKSLTKVMWAEHTTLPSLLQSDPDLLQLAIYVVSVAAVQLLRAEGMRPDCMLGHSFGEIAALTCAGVYTVEQGAEIVCDRVECLAQYAPSDGAMMAFPAKASNLQLAINRFYAARMAQSPKAGLSIAVVNHDSQTVISGSRDELAEFAQFCTGQGMLGTLLQSPYAFHHPNLEPVVSAFADRLAAYRSGPLRGAVYSAILQRYYLDTDDFGKCLARHLVLPVRFDDAVKTLHAQNVGTFIECGALDALSKITIRVLGPGNANVFPSLVKSTDELGNVRKIIHHFNKEEAMNTRVPAEILMPEFESFWAERGSVISAQIKAEFIRFIEQQRVAQIPTLQPAQIVAAAPANTLAAQQAQAQIISRDRLFKELVGIYAEAMEYPVDVFTEEVELEAELGIDSVKQTEIIGRITKQYSLPPLPANFRSGDYKTMGQIVDFVFFNQGKTAVAA